MSDGIDSTFRSPERCEYCQSLTLSSLVELARIALNIDSHVSKYAHYKHHRSIADLEFSAKSGCDVCSLFITTLKCHEDTTSWVAEKWRGKDCEEQSLYAAAQDLPYSDVKISLVCSESYSHDTFETTTVLDTILVQVGPSQDFSGVSPSWEPDEDEPEFPVLQFQLITDRDDPVNIDGKRIGRYAFEPRLAAESNFKIARQWLDQCEMQHDECLKPELPELPPRILRLDENDTGLRLHIPNGDRARFVALSHCWGGHIETVLLKHNLNQFRQQIDISTLPLNFQDAISITRRLGLCYLWIDSLCILQDSKDDWARHAEIMGSIYRNSSLTISALASKGSSTGIFPRSTDHVQNIPEALSLYVGGNDKQLERSVQLKVSLREEESLKLLQMFGPLYQRGWCLQESFLAPRQIYFGKEQIYWKCPKGYSSLDGTTGGYLRMPEDGLPHLSAILHRDVLASPPSIPHTISNIIIKEYHDLVNQYTSRNLTYGSDRLPAFAGIASSLQNFFGGAYLAGIWTAFLPNTLLWYKEMRTCKHITPYRAPSWSWMVTDDTILFDFDEVLPSCSTSMQLIDHTIKLKNEDNPYGEVEFASMIVRGLILTLELCQQIICGRLDDCYYRGYAYFDDLEVGFHYLLVEERGPDVRLIAINNDWSKETADLDLDSSAFTDENLLALVVHVDEEDDSSESVKTASGVIVKPVDKDTASDHDWYERVGYFTFANLKRSSLQAGSWKTICLV